MLNRCVNILFLLVISSYNGYGLQKYEKKRIDSTQLQKISSLIKDAQLEQALLLNIELVENAKKNQDTETIALGYIQIANILCTFGQHLESIRYLNLADNLVYEKQNAKLKIKIFSNYGRNYSALKINQKSIDYYSNGIALCKKKEPHNQQLLASLFSNKASAFLNTNNKLDSTLVYLHKAVKTKKTPFRYAVLTNYYLKEIENIDSAKYYLNKCKVLMNQDNVSTYHKSIIFQAEANLYKATGNYANAIELYKKSLNISNRMKKYIEVKLLYKLISETYELLHEEEKAHKYLVKYIMFTDSINIQYKKSVDVVISNFLKEQEESHKKTKKRLSFLIWGSILLFIIIVYIIVLYYKKIRLGLIEEKEKVIEQKRIESYKLKQKLNVAFEEVINLAKTNDSSFLIRFQEVYPKVCRKLLEVNPKLVNTELSLCAMIWLNFSSKDIAKYTNVQPKTVQTKKYRLRKKLVIPEDVNIYVWIKNL